MLMYLFYVSYASNTVKDSVPQSLGFAFRSRLGSKGRPSGKGEQCHRERKCQWKVVINRSSLVLSQ
jgi:hypothetical protein